MKAEDRIREALQRAGYSVAMEAEHQLGIPEVWRKGEEFVWVYESHVKTKVAPSEFAALLTPPGTVEETVTISRQSAKVLYGHLQYASDEKLDQQLLGAMMELRRIFTALQAQPPAPTFGQLTDKMLSELTPDELRALAIKSGFPAYLFAAPTPATVAGLTADDLRWAATEARHKADGFLRARRSETRNAPSQGTCQRWRDRAERFEAAAGEGE